MTSPTEPVRAAEAEADSEATPAAPRLEQFEEGITLDRFITETANAHPENKGKFSALLRQVSLASRAEPALSRRGGSP